MYLVALFSMGRVPDVKSVTKCAFIDPQVAIEHTAFPHVVDGPSGFGFCGVAYFVTAGISS